MSGGRLTPLRRFGGTVALAIVIASATTSPASSAVIWGSQHAIPRAYSWNYGSALDFSGTPGDPSFQLHDVFVSDARTPQAAYTTSSPDGASWRTPVRVSGGTVNAEATTIAAAGRRLIVGWVTGFSAYDPGGAPRQLQVAVSGDDGSMWKAPKGLTPATGRIDLPVVAAAKTDFGPVNLYAAWVDATTGKVYVRIRTGAGAWSLPVRLGTTTLRDPVDGYHGAVSMAAVGNLVTIAWIANAKGALTARAIDLSTTSAAGAATAGNWDAPVALRGHVSLDQGGYPVVSASPLSPDVVTIAWNTATRQVYTTFDGTTVVATRRTIWIDGTAHAVAYTGGYATAVEPAPGGGFVAMWAACRDTSLANDCNGAKGAARIDLLGASSTDGVTFSPPTRVASSVVADQRTNDDPSIVATDGRVYVQYDGYDGRFADYDIFARVGTGTY